MVNKLVTENFGGNLHQTAAQINKEGLADYVLIMECSHGSTVVVFKMPEDMAHAYRESKFSHVGPANHDDQKLQCFMTNWQNRPQGDADTIQSIVLKAEGIIAFLEPQKTVELNTVSIGMLIELLKQLLEEVRPQNLKGGVYAPK